MSIRNGTIVAILLLASGIAGSAETAGAQSSALGSGLGDMVKMPDFFRGTWMTYASFVEADAKLNVPYTAAAQKYVDAYKQKRDIPYAEEGCRSPGLPISMRTGPIKFVYSPGLISIYMQNVGNTRFIRMNQKQGQTTPRYYGNSVGHFEGDTLVVETVDFVPELTFQYGIGKPLPPENTIGTASLPRLGGAPGGAPRGGGPPGGAPGGAPRGGGPPGGAEAPSPIQGLSAAIWGPHGPGLRMVERMRVINPDTLEVNLTVYDDTVWTKPFVTATRNYRRSPTGEPQEWMCTISITSFDPETNTYNDKDPEEMIKYLDKLGR